LATEMGIGICGLSASILRHTLDSGFMEHARTTPEHAGVFQACSLRRSDEQKKLLTTMRLARNYLSHEADLFPEPQDALLLLAGAFKLAELQICTEKS